MPFPDFRSTYALYIKAATNPLPFKFLAIAAVILLGVVAGLVFWTKNIANESSNLPAQVVESIPSSPLPSAVSEPTGETVYISEDGIRIRSMPNVSSPIIVTAPQNMPLKVLKTASVVHDGYTWINVGLPYDSYGWVANKFVSKEKIEIQENFKPYSIEIMRAMEYFREYPSYKSKELTMVTRHSNLIATGRKIQDGEMVWLYVQEKGGDGDSGWLERSSITLPRPKLERAEVAEEPGTGSGGGLDSNSTLSDWQSASEYDKGYFAAGLTWAFYQDKGETLDDDTIKLKAGFMMMCLNNAVGEMSGSSSIGAAFLACASALGF